MLSRVKPANRQTPSVETNYIVLDGKDVVLSIDHDMHRQIAWQLCDGEWREADLADVLFNGRVVSKEYLGQLPELPSHTFDFDPAVAGPGKRSTGSSSQ